MNAASFRAALLGAATSLLALLPFSPAGAQQPTPTGMVMGQVIESGTHRPISGVTVRVSGVPRRALTDANGEFVLRHVPVGTQVAMIGRMGYRPQVQEWDVDTDTLQMLVSLATETLTLEEITVQVDRLDARLRGSGLTAVTFRPDQGATADHSAAAYVLNRLGMTRTACPQAGAAGQRQALTIASGFDECFWLRGGAQRICVVIDEAPTVAGMAELDSYRPEDIFRIDVFGGGTFIEAYTKSFMARSAHRPWVPMPVESAEQAFCNH